MKVLVLGATGGIGREVLTQGVARGHQLTALVRSPEKLAGVRGVNVVEGNPLDPHALRATAKDHHAVITTLGAPGIGKSTLLTDGMRALTDALEGSTTRVLLVSAAVLFEDAGLVAAFLRNAFLRNVARDSREAEALLTASALPWTVVRPPRLTHGPHTGTWRLAVGTLPPKGTSISRADVADCVLSQLDAATHVHRVLGVAR